LIAPLEMVSTVLSRFGVKLVGKREIFLEN
jgi:hypothetical protein